MATPAAAKHLQWFGNCWTKAIKITWFTIVGMAVMRIPDNHGKGFMDLEIIPELNPGKGKPGECHPMRY